MATISDGVYIVYPEGSDSEAVVVKGGKVVEVYQSCLYDIFRAAGDYRAEYFEGSQDEPDILDADSTRHFVRLLSEGTGHELNPECFTVERI